MNLETAREICLSLPNTFEADHFGKPSYRVGKKIFATLWLDEKRMIVKLPPNIQANYCEKSSQAYSPVEGYWGKQGWTQVELSKGISKNEIEILLQIAWSTVAPKKINKLSTPE